MKKAALVMFMLFIAIFSAMQVNAKIWRVNNNSNYNATTLWGDNFGGTVDYPVFKQLVGTFSANVSGLVMNGDTIHLEGSTADYAGGDLTKRLVIIGPGYFLNENPNTSNNLLPAILKIINFNTGSSGSQLIGVHVGNNSSGIDINVSDILIKRCKIEEAISLEPGTSDIKILQNFFSRTSNTTVIGGSSAGFPSDFIFNNNIVLGVLSLLQPGYTMLECKNNVFAGLASSGPTLRLSAGSFQNNIMTNSGATTDINGGTELNVTYNTGSTASQFGGGTGNIVIANMATSLFVASGTSDGKYQLQPGSAAGSDGTERGAYGGLSVTSRYALSGLAPIPVIYEINTSGVATPSGLNVNIKARTIK